MTFIVIIVTILCISKSCAIIREHFRDVFEYSFDGDLRNCTSRDEINNRYFLRMRNENYPLQDVCNNINLNSLKYFPKCCPPGFSFQRSHHKCVRNDNNTTNIYDTFSESLLTKSHLDCSIINDHVIEDDSIVIMENRSIFFNGEEYNVNKYCIDWDILSASTVVRVCENQNFCRKYGSKCIRKCCRDGFSFLKKKCILNSEYGISIQNISRFEKKTDDFNAIQIAPKCTHKRYRPSQDVDFTIKPNGKLALKDVNQWIEYSVEDDMYCVEYLLVDKTYDVFLCSVFGGRSWLEARFHIYKWTSAMSCFCLALTLLGYLFLQNLNEFLGKIIICFCTCLLIAFAILTYVQFKPELENSCVLIGFLVSFFMLASFSWLNVLSFEIYTVLGSMSTYQGRELYNTTKKFLRYNAYAWSIPILIMGVAVVDYNIEFLPNYLRPEVGITHCLFVKSHHENNYGYAVFFTIPSAILLLTNLVIFIKTMLYICGVKRAVAKLVSSHDSEGQRRLRLFNIDNERMIMGLRISLIMGLNWLFEIISSLPLSADFRNVSSLAIIEAILDVFNCLEGVLIFCVFMLKKKVIDAVMNMLKIQRRARTSSTPCTTEELVQININSSKQHIR